MSILPVALATIFLAFLTQGCANQTIREERSLEIIVQDESRDIFVEALTDFAVDNDLIFDHEEFNQMPRPNTQLYIRNANVFVIGGDVTQRGRFQFSFYADSSCNPCEREIQMLEGQIVEAVDDIVGVHIIR